MGWVCSVYEGEEKCIKDFVGEHYRKETISRM